MESVVEHYLGEKPAELSEQELKDYLKKAGDFVIYSCAAIQDRLIVHFFREVMIELGKIIPAQTPGRFLINQEDFVEKLGGDIPRLVAFIDSKLKIQIAWDFDKTLTRVHTWSGPDMPRPPSNKKDNQRSPKQTTQVLEAIADHPRYLNTVATNNYCDTTIEYLQAWYEERWEDLFVDVQGRDPNSDIGKLKSDAICESMLLLTCGAINEDGCLKLKTGFLIAIVAVYLVDDFEGNLNQVGACGIHGIKVDDSGLQHLLTLNETLNLGQMIQSEWTESSSNFPLTTSPIHHGPSPLPAHDDVKKKSRLLPEEEDNEDSLRVSDCASIIQTHDK